MPPKKQAKKEVDLAHNDQESTEPQFEETKEKKKGRSKSNSKQLQTKSTEAESENVSIALSDAQAPKKVRKTNGGGDVKEEAKKSAARRIKSKPVSYAEDSDESDGEDVAGDDSDDSSDDEEFQVKGQKDSSSSESEGEDEEEEEEKKGAKSRRSQKIESKKRTRDGKPKVVKEKQQDKKEDKNKAKPGKDNKDKDEGKKMMNEKEAKVAIRDYMIKQNRPYSLQNVIDNLHGRIKKTICQKCLDDLTDEKILTCKEYGKAKLYLANQDNFPTTSTVELTKLDEKIKDYKDELSEYQQRLKDLQNQLKDASNGLINEQLKAEILRLKSDNKTYKERVKVYTDADFKMISEDEVNQAKKDLLKYANEWKKRKRNCMDIIDTICESADLNRKEFIKKLGLDQDEDFKVNVNDLISC